jgi:hydrogenase maturation factor
MCVAFPAVVVAVDGLSAEVQTGDRQLRASTLLVPDLAPGELVAVAAGTIVDRLSADEATELLALLHGARTNAPAKVQATRAATPDARGGHDNVSRV